MGDKFESMNLPQSLASDSVSPGTKLLEKRRQMFEVQEALNAQKEEFARREEAFRRREESLRKKDLELQESLIKFNKFLQENEAKRVRAERRANDEIKIRQNKEKQVEQLKEELREMKEQCDSLETTVQRNMKYQSYLERVQEAAPEDYTEIAELLNRYTTLTAANKDLRSRQEVHEVMNESKRGEYVQYTKEQTNEILNSNNEIASLQKDLEQSETVALRLQNDVDSQIRSTSDRTKELGQVLLGIENLLQRCTSKQHGAIIKHTETNKDEQAMVIQKITDLTKRKGAQAIADLDIIAAYMVDFNSIVEALKSRRQ